MPGTSIHGQDLSGINRVIRTDSVGQLVSAAQAGDDSTFDVKSVLQKGQSATVTASGTVKATPGFVISIFIIATGSGTFRLRDGGASGSILVGEASNAVPTSAGTLFNFGAAIEFGTDIYFELAAGTLAANIIYL